MSVPSGLEDAVPHHSTQVNDHGFSLYTSMSFWSSSQSLNALHITCNGSFVVFNSGIIVHDSPDGLNLLCLVLNEVCLLNTDFHTGVIPLAKTVLPKGNPKFI